MSNVLKVGSFVSGSVIGTWGLFCDGYLLEPDYEKGTNDPIVVSLCGKKGSIDSFIKVMKESNTFIQKTGVNSFDKKNAHQIRNTGVDYFSSDPANQHLLVVDTEVVIDCSLESLNEFCRSNRNAHCSDKTAPYKVTILGAEETTSETLKKLAVMKAEGKIKFYTVTKRQQEGSLFKRFVYVAKKARQEDISGDTTEAYLIGNTRVEARAQFWNILDRLSIPIDISWEEIFWAEFQKLGWIKELEGHRMAGFKLSLPAAKEEGSDEGFDLYDLLSRLIEDDSLPNIIPEEEVNEPAVAETTCELEGEEDEDMPAKALLAA